MTSGIPPEATQIRVAEITAFMAEWAALDLAEEWDNVGLLLGDRHAPATSVMTCLTLTPDVAKEAVDEGAKLVISHHPVLFRPVQRLVTDSVEGAMLLSLIQAGIAVYSPHTGYDSSREGINRQLATLLGLQNVKPLRPVDVGGEDGGNVGGGRYGDLPAPLSLAELLRFVKQQLRVAHTQYVGDTDSVIARVGIACGAAAEFLRDAHAEGCQVLLTGEARFHACLEARSLGMGLILPGHYATERPAMEQLARILQENFPGVHVWASRRESDPLQWC